MIITHADAAKIHNQFWLEAFDSYIEAFKPKYILPFAGKYWLTDNFSNRNSLKNTVDPINLKKDYDNVIVLADGGEHYIDLSNDEISKERDYPYDIHLISKSMVKQKHKYKEEISFKRDISHSIEKLLHLSAVNANKMQKKNETFFVFHLEDSMDSSKILALILLIYFWVKESEVITCNQDMQLKSTKSLFGLLSGVYIWQSTISSSFQRVPDEYSMAICGSNRCLNHIKMFISENNYQDI